MGLRSVLSRMFNRPTLPEHSESEQVLIRFTADWCMPCKQFAPVFDEFVAAAGLPSVVVNVDERMDLAEAFGVRSIPAVFYANGDNYASLKSRTVPELLEELARY